MLIDLCPDLRLQVASDLHLPHWRVKGQTLTLRADPRAHVLVLAGDLCDGLPTPDDSSWLRDLSDCAAWPDGIVMVPGNHDHYGLDLDTATDAWREALRGTRIQLLQREVAMIRGVRIAGCTFWTDFDRTSPLALLAARRLSDYAYITKGGAPIDPTDILAAHFTDRDWLLDLPRGSEDAPLVVVTHHAPSWQSAHPWFDDSACNGAYVCDAHDILDDLCPALWVHGHVHARHDYRLGSTRIVCNPVGYCGESVPDGRLSVVQEDVHV